jgi:hypothetical protein
MTLSPCFFGLETGFTRVRGVVVFSNFSMDLTRNIVLEGTHYDIRDFSLTPVSSFSEPHEEGYTQRGS